MFSEIFRILKLKDNSEMEAISKAVLGENPIARMAQAKSRNPPVRGIRLSNLETSHPESGSPMRELTGMNKRIVPNSASLYPNVVLMVGIREAQDAKQKPDKKKNKLRKNLCLFLTSMRMQLRCEYHMYHSIFVGLCLKYLRHRLSYNIASGCISRRPAYAEAALRRQAQSKSQVRMQETPGLVNTVPAALSKKLY